MEYVMVIGFALLLLVPIVIIFFIQTNDLQDSVNMNMAKEAARTIIEHAELVYYLGAPSFVEVTVTLPERVQSVSIQGDQITFEVEVQAGLSDVFEAGTVNMTGNMSARSGKHTLRIQAAGSIVNITEA